MWCACVCKRERERKAECRSKASNKFLRFERGLCLNLMTVLFIRRRILSSLDLAIAQSQFVIEKTAPSFQRETNHNTERKKRRSRQGLHFEVDWIGSEDLWRNDNNYAAVCGDGMRPPGFMLCTTPQPSNTFVWGPPHFYNGEWKRTGTAALFSSLPKAVNSYPANIKGRM